MNVAYFLTPRSEVGCVLDDHTLRQGLEKLRRSGYTALPVVTKENKYVGTVSEGDFLWYLIEDGEPRTTSIRALERTTVRDVLRFDRNPPVRITADIQELLGRAMNQNFIPVVDDLGSFIGIVTRKDIIKQFADAVETAEIRKNQVS